MNKVGPEVVPFCTHVLVPFYLRLSITQHRLFEPPIFHVPITLAITAVEGREMAESSCGTKLRYGRYDRPPLGPLRFGSPHAATAPGSVTSSHALFPDQCFEPVSYPDLVGLVTETQVIPTLISAAFDLLE